MSFLIAKQAPDFKAKAISADGTIIDDFGLSSLRGKYVILFFYPLDFTFVCPTEILAFNERLEEFKSRDAEIIGVSVDSVYTHAAWRKTKLEDGGIGPIRYPLVSDLNKRIARDYGVLLDDEVALRGLFLIDREGIIRHTVINDQPLGRSVTEALRMLDALRMYDQRGLVCPANWKQGDAGMNETKESVIDYLSKFSDKADRD
jgi:peroxiredoxin (alkyl hydroperoxide reductase subunit C)